MFSARKKLVASILGVCTENGVLGVWGTLWFFDVLERFRELVRRGVPPAHPPPSLYSLELFGGGRQM